MTLYPIACKSYNRYIIFPSFESYNRYIIFPSSLCIIEDFRIYASVWFVFLLKINLFTKDVNPSEPVIYSL